MKTFIKDPDSTLDYQVDWCPWLRDSTIASSTWSVTGSDLAVGSGQHAPTNTLNVTKVWLSGGAEGQRYTVTNHITTADGRADDRSFIIAVQSR